MTKLDWERPRFAWERVTNEDHLLEASEDRSASSIMRRVYVHQAISQCQELDKKYISAQVKKIRDQILHDTGIAVVDIFGIPHGSDWHLTVVIKHCDQDVITLSKLLQILGASRLSIQVTKKGNHSIRCLMRATNSMLSAFGNVDKVRIPYREFSSANPVREYETQNPIICSASYDTHKYTWGVSREFRRFERNDLYVLVSMRTVGIGENGKKVWEREASVYPSYLRIRVMSLADRTGYKWLNFEILDDDYRVVKFDPDDNYPIWAQLAMSVVECIVELLEIYTWETLVAANP